MTTCMEPQTDRAHDPSQHRGKGRLRVNQGSDQILPPESSTLCIAEEKDGGNCRERGSGLQCKYTQGLFRSPW